jgi:hypothetical protein
MGKDDVEAVFDRRDEDRATDRRGSERPALRDHTAGAAGGGGRARVGEGRRAPGCLAGGARGRAAGPDDETGEILRRGGDPVRDPADESSPEAAGLADRANGP